MTENPPATRVSRVALITCADLPGLDPDDHLLVRALRARGFAVAAAVWDDPAVDWSAFHLAVLRSTWDYPGRRAAFLAWAGAVPRLANPAPVVAWNTDKGYLDDLAAAGVPVVSSHRVEPGQPWRPPAGGQWVVKPAVGAGSVDAGRYRLDDPEQRRSALAHVDRLQRQQRPLLVQPYLPAVDVHGETGLVFLADPSRGDVVHSHAVRKGPMLTGPAAAVEGLFVPEQITGRTASVAELAVARRALAAVPGGSGRLLYARVDLVPGPESDPVVLELELTEPSLFLAHGGGAADRLAAAIAAGPPAARVAADPVAHGDPACPPRTAAAQ
jgi:hypothetical protein